MANYINREIAALAFNERVLMQAEDNKTPILEKLNFEAIFASNIDEFFMVRVAGLKDQISAGYKALDNAELSPTEQLTQVMAETTKLSKKEQLILKDRMKELEDFNIILNPELSTESLIEASKDIFIDAILPVISPVTIDNAHPFPFIYNRRLCIFVEIKKKNKSQYSIIMIPENMNRFYIITDNGKKVLLTCEYIIKHHLDVLYKGYDILSSHIFRITRNADIEMRSEDMADIMAYIKSSLSKRQKGEVTRFEVEASIPKKSIEFLKNAVKFTENDIIYIDGILDLTFLSSISKALEKHMPISANAIYPAFEGIKLFKNKITSKIFDEIKKRDIFSFRPYYSFSFISELIKVASSDKNVLAIKMTLYRTNRDSSILSSLIDAAHSGKQVSVVVELKARFDEEHNIDWAKNLEDAGCIVTYGIANLKIHAKCLLIVRRERGGIKRYTHIATGNYNENTAKVYTDIDLITANDAIGKDASTLFNYLMAYTDENSWNALTVAPFNLRTNILSLFDNEIKNAKLGKKAEVIMKMNSLLDKEIIDKIYEASNAGVKVSLIVRGICAIKSGIKGMSENVTVISIVGRFLEHARIFYFKNGNKPKYFIASSDMMPRNLNRRVELMCQITDENMKKALKEILNTSLKDNELAWLQEGDTFKKIKHTDNEEAINSQEIFQKGINYIINS